MEAGCIKLRGGEGVWVAGPARVRVEEGEVLATGFRLRGEALVRATRGASFYAAGQGARLCISLGSGAAAERIEGGWEVVEAWLGLVEELGRSGARRVVLLGGVESGKSTMAAWLHNSLGLGVVEADVGQNELGTPGCVSYTPGSGDPVLSLQDLEPEACFFAGHVSADRVLGAVTGYAAAAAGRLREKGFVIDTDGYVEPRGVYQKAALAEAVGADAVIVLGDPGLARRLRSLGLPVREAPGVGGLARRRSRLDRRAYRARLWARLFADAKPTVLTGVEILGLAPWSTGGDGTPVYSCGGRETRPRRRWEQGLLAAATGPGRRGDTLVVVESIDPAEARAVVRPARGASLEGAAALKLGWVRLSQNYEEEHLPTLPHPCAEEARGRAARRPGPRRR